MAAMTEKLQKLAEQHQEEMITIRRRLHENPELSMKEEQTTAFIKEQCREYGLKEADVELESGAVFLLNPEKAEKSIIFRADIDKIRPPVYAIAAAMTSIQRHCCSARGSLAAFVRSLTEE